MSFLSRSSIALNSFLARSSTASSLFPSTVVSPSPHSFAAFQTRFRSKRKKIKRKSGIPRLPRWNKSESTRLFGFVSRVVFNFNLCDRRNVLVREMMTRLHAPRIVDNNPKLQLVINEHEKPDPPSLEFHFVDGSEYILNPCVREKISDIFMYVHSRAERVDFHTEIDQGDDEPVNIEDIDKL